MPVPLKLQCYLLYCIRQSILLQKEHLLVGLASPLELLLVASWQKQHEQAMVESLALHLRLCAVEIWFTMYLLPIFFNKPKSFRNGTISRHSFKWWHSVIGGHEFIEARVSLRVRSVGIRLVNVAVHVNIEFGSLSLRAWCSLKGLRILFRWC
jgi:hypothetical protein